MIQIQSLYLIPIEKKASLYSVPAVPKVTKDIKIKYFEKV